ncbi:hypothetical protein K466DRAFT_277547 [Polyporus arcularius HHB13444]|uniref:Uncharacterized protein n=1 Tax=Polyporus arcularius HHB13444 TaxID=1314778 RepID=A0A5C3P2E1_9APHY|nr:hypothetical protein K466DRAFT_277547 [Polyporus arcularius HHB13444]
MSTVLGSIPRRSPPFGHTTPAHADHTYTHRCTAIIATRHPGLPTPILSVYTGSRPPARSPIHCSSCIVATWDVGNTHLCIPRPSRRPVMEPHAPPTAMPPVLPSTGPCLMVESFPSAGGRRT